MNGFRSLSIAIMQLQSKPPDICDAARFQRMPCIANLGRMHLCKSSTPLPTRSFHARSRPFVHRPIANVLSSCTCVTHLPSPTSVGARLVHVSFPRGARAAAPRLLFVVRIEEQEQVEEQKTRKSRTSGRRSFTSGRSERTQNKNKNT